jgi:signal transduction histidine kinase
MHNAVKYSPADSAIEIRMEPAGARVRLTIEDHGVGIRTRDLPRVFDLYYTGDNGRDNDQSSGIGLYLVKTILDDLGHDITIESKVDQGTRVSLLL